MKKLNLMLIACLCAVSLNAQLLSVPPSLKSVAIADISTDLKVMKMNRVEKQVSRITMGETVSQLSVMRQKKMIVLTVLNANPSIKFTIEDEAGHVLITDKITSNLVIKTYKVGKLADGEYSIILSGSGITSKRFFTVTNAQISLQDDLGIVSRTN